MFKVYQCNKCRTQVMNLEDNKLECCGSEMVELIPNSVDAAFEKHVPTYKVAEGIVKARVNHVMEEDHYIEWIAYVANSYHEVKYFEAYMPAEAEFKYVKGTKLYAYCNKHGLWMSAVE